MSKPRRDPAGCTLRSAGRFTLNCCSLVTNLSHGAERASFANNIALSMVHYDSSPLVAFCGGRLPCSPPNSAFDHWLTKSAITSRLTRRIWAWREVARRRNSFGQARFPSYTLTPIMSWCPMCNTDLALPESEKRILRLYFSEMDEPSDHSLHIRWSLKDQETGTRPVT